MLKVRFFLNEPMGKPWRHFSEMAPRLGDDYPIEIEITSKPHAEYRTDEWTDTDLPCAPAIMVGEEVVAEGSDIKEETVVAEIRKQLGMPQLETEKKGILDRFFS